MQGSLLERVDHTKTFLRLGASHTDMDMVFTFRKTAYLLWTTLHSAVAQEGLAIRPLESVLMLSTQEHAVLLDTCARMSLPECLLRNSTA